MEIPQIVITYIDTFNRGDLDACLATFAPDGTFSSPPTAQPISGQAIKDLFGEFFTGFPAPLGVSPDRSQCDLPRM